MGSIWKVSGLVLLLLLALPAQAEDEEMDEPSVEAFVISIRSAKETESASIEKSILVPLRKAYAERGVLFLDLDLSSKATKNQARLLMSATGLGHLYAKYKSKAGTAIVFDPFNDRVVLEMNAKTKPDAAMAALKKVLEGDDEDDEDMGG